ncbi:TonB-dependent siderophore receptor [Thiomicrorhabdus sp.]|uniref:TonB-dependent receptor n=1 Tax=Thiomicrorhabdus sp. TaxID=2039724 RepID=UPI0029C75665|nr:TonB-dependent siderophore receptor [Thiomicrorhabdus sp.]
MNFSARPKLLPLLIWSLSSPAFAQADEKNSQTELQGVTVTANKIEENIQDVPQSITVIDQYELEEKGIRSVPDVIREIPNMNVNPMGGNQVSFRGLTTSIFTNNNPVVIYIDGVPTSSRYGFDASLANVERVEVLRGPQGTLYGKDAIGAVINIVTKEPDNAWHGKLGMEAGSQNRRSAIFDTSGALIKDRLYLGLNGLLSADDGWIENTQPGMPKHANTDEQQKFGAYLLYKPSERLKAKLNIIHEETENHWWDGYALPGGSGVSDFHRDNAEKIAFDVPQIEQGTTDAQSLNIGYEFDHLNLESTTVHKNFVLDGVYDSDFGTDSSYAGLRQLNDNETETLSQEFRFSSKNSIGMRWVSGLYLEDEERTQAPYGMEFPGGDGYNYLMNAESVTNSTTQAAFGQLILPVAENLELTLGGRLQRIEKEIDLQMYYLPVGTSGPAMYTLEDKKTWDAFLPKVALSYKLAPSWTTYASYSKGYMPGGYNYFSTQGNADENSFEPQTSNNYEIGIKGQFEDLSLSANIFHMDIEDIHVYKAIGTTYLTDNAEKAHSQGIELEANWYATQNLQFSATLGFINAKYDKYNNGYTDFEGRNIIETPSQTARFGIAYTSPENWYARMDVANQGSLYYYDDANKKMVKRKGYTTVDLRAGYRLTDWEIYAFAKNLTDEEYITGYMSSSSTSVATFGDPRTFGLGAHYHF